MLKQLPQQAKSTPFSSHEARVTRETRHWMQSNTQLLSQNFDTREPEASKSHSTDNCLQPLQFNACWNALLYQISSHRVEIPNRLLIELLFLSPFKWGPSSQLRRWLLQFSLKPWICQQIGQVWTVEQSTSHPIRPAAKSTLLSPLVVGAGQKLPKFPSLLYYIAFSGRCFAFLASWIDLGFCRKRRRNTRDLKRHKNIKIKFLPRFVFI